MCAGRRVAIACQIAAAGVNARWMCIWGVFLLQDVLTHVDAGLIRSRVPDNVRLRLFGYADDAQC